MKEKRKIQILGILLCALALMSLISLAGHVVPDDMMILSDEAVYGNPFSLPYSNPGGMMGAYLSYVAFFFLGWSAYFAGLFLLVLSLKIIGWEYAGRVLKHAGMLWTLVYGLLFLGDITSVSEATQSAAVPDGVGALGHTLIEGMLLIVGVPGAFILGIAALVSALVYYASISHRFRHLLSFIRDRLVMFWNEGWERARPAFGEMRDRLSLRRTSEDAVDRPKRKRSSVRRIAPTPGSDGPNCENSDEPVRDQIVVDDIIKATPSNGQRNRRSVKLPGKPESVPPTDDAESTDGMPDTFTMPTTDILIEAPEMGPAYDEKELEETARSLRDTLETFGVRLGGNIEMFPGPVITRFEIKPAAGIKVNQIANLSEDLALNLRAKSIRIVAPVPGKAAVGIEIPNRNPQMVYLRDLLESEAFENSTYELPLALGKDISGNPFVADMAAMPHLLIAGTTGSGKSVCMNVIITSLMFKLHPSQLKFIFIDPKMLELTVYKGIPHLIDKVVTNPKQAERVLNDAVMEMERRYRTLANVAVRNIVDYNKKVKTDEERLPYIVIVIDELADLMISAHSSRVEMLITRLAQMARAVGIHLILATQRPSVDVITGLIKANFPSRVAFQVATRTDSRTILDGNGAERLLGNGDMLFLKAGAPEPERLHGPYISSSETEELVAFITSQRFSQVKVEEAKVVAEEKSQMRHLNDPVLIEAIDAVVTQGQASVSLLQRKLGIGYQRAARLIDELEEMKIIGPYAESKARDVLVDKAFVADLKNGKLSKT